MARPRRLKVSLLSAFAALLVLGLVMVLVLDRHDGSGTTPAAAAVQRTAGQPSASSIYKGARDGVVSITFTGGQSTALGSGIVLDKKGNILTNAHVIDGASKVTVSFGADKSVTRTAKVVGKDNSTDLAVIKVDPSGLSLHPLSLGDSSKASVGDTAYAIGNPFGYTDSFSEGIISGLDRQITAPNGFGIDHVIQTDAAINPGNSGGPLLDSTGQVIGINAQIATDQSAASGEGSNSGVGFAIPSNTAKTVVSQLESSGRVSHAYLGVSTVTVSGSLQGSLTGANSGALVQSVQSGSPADKADLQAGDRRTDVDGATVVLGGDVIQAIDGKAIQNADGLAAAIGSHKPGDSIQVQVLRDGQQKTFTVTLGSQPSKAPGS
jgi:S1-C subfamily serine protease